MSRRGRAYALQDHHRAYLARRSPADRVGGRMVWGVATSSLKTKQSTVAWPGLVSRRLLQTCMTCHSCRWLTHRPSRAQNRFAAVGLVFPSTATAGALIIRRSGKLWTSFQPPVLGFVLALDFNIAGRHQKRTRTLAGNQRLDTRS